jgi:copper chaperone CopZ
MDRDSNHRPDRHWRAADPLCELRERIGNGLRRLPGVRSARASSKTQRVEVAIDPAQVSSEQVRAKLEQLGFAAELTGPPGA